MVSLNFFQVPIDSLGILTSLCKVHTGDAVEQGQGALGYWDEVPVVILALPHEFEKAADPLGIFDSLFTNLADDWISM